jgi:hypothetical protein
MYFGSKMLVGRNGRIKLGKIDSRTVVAAMKNDSARAGTMIFHPADWRESGFRVRLYRFMAESIPLINSVIWTWSRLAAAPGGFATIESGETIERPDLTLVLRNLFRRINRANFGHGGTPEDLLQPFFKSLFLDGAVLGRLELEKDLSGVAGFRFFDLAHTSMTLSPNGDITAVESTERGDKAYSGSNLFYYALNADAANPYGRSVLKAIPFVAYVEQQLVDDMRKTMHNAGYHRLHIRIAPPDRREGETDDSYAARANEYFDRTVSMIKDIEPEDNPVTWNDVAVEYIGPPNQGGTKVSNWYLSHRAMIEEICSGTHLAPFLLGYAYNTATNWAQFKYDLVMRQVRSVQNAAVSFLDWLANIELSLRGFSATAAWRFDNSMSALAGNEADVRRIETDYIVRLYEAGLIDRAAAAERAARLL